MKGPVELWKKLPDVDGTEVSSFGRIRSSDGHYYNSHQTNRGYLNVRIKIDGKWITKSVHRLIAQTFVPNPNKMTDVNHKDSSRTNNNAGNLNWCTHQENIAYRDKFGKSIGHPLFVINLTTLKVSNYPSQSKASIALGINSGSVNAVISGRTKQAHGYWFVNADDSAVDITKQKLREIGKTKLTAADTASADFVSQVITE